MDSGSQRNGTANRFVFVDAHRLWSAPVRCQGAGVVRVEPFAAIVLDVSAGWTQPP